MKNMQKMSAMARTARRGVNTIVVRGELVARRVMVVSSAIPYRIGSLAAPAFSSVFRSMLVNVGTSIFNRYSLKCLVGVRRRRRSGDVE